MSQGRQEVFDCFSALSVLGENKTRTENQSAGLAEQEQTVGARVLRVRNFEYGSIVGVAVGIQNLPRHRGKGGSRGQAPWVPQSALNGPIRDHFSKSGEKM